MLLFVLAWSWREKEEGNEIHFILWWQCDDGTLFTDSTFSLLAKMYFVSKATRQHFLFDQLRSLCFSLIIKRKYFFWFSSFLKKLFPFFPPLWFSSLSVCRYEWSIRDYTRALIFPHSERNNKSKCDGMRRWRRWSIESTVCLLSINHAGSPGVVAFVWDMMRIFQSGKSVFLTAAKVEWIRALNVHH